MFFLQASFHTQLVATIPTISNEGDWRFLLNVAMDSLFILQCVSESIPFLWCFSVVTQTGTTMSSRGRT